MPSRKTLLVYLVLFSIVSPAAGLTYRLIDWGIAVAGCKLHREPGTFLAYCGSAQYGDYEHGAYYFDLEPEAIENLKKAEVLFFGNSRAEFGFSTDELRNYFNKRSIPFYVMAFAYGETSEFARILIEKLNLKPEVLVVHTDPFFTDGLSEPASRILDDSGSFWQRGLRFIQIRWEYLTKALFNRLQPKLCDLLPMLCSSEYRALYRAKKDGLSIWRDLYSSAEGDRIPIDGSNRAVFGPDYLVAVKAHAPRFFATAGVRPECVILTAIPNSLQDARSFTVESARLLGAQAVLPELVGLQTIDASHLNWASAQLWSGAFMRGIDSVVTRCVSGARAPDKAPSDSVADPARPANPG